MSKDDPFTLPNDAYQRDINIFNNYIKEASQYLHIKTGKSLEECTLYMKKNLSKSGKFPFQDRDIRVIKKKDNGDKELTTDTLSKFFLESIHDEDFITPTLAAFMNTNKKVSFISEDTQDNNNIRDKIKKEMFAANMAGDTFLETLKNNDQLNKKINNNSISGASCVENTPLYHPVMHPVLTSICRTTSAYANGNCEKLITGNRHYHRPDIVLNNLVSLSHNFDHDLLKASMERFHLHYPTPDEVIEVITYSSDNYFHNETYLNEFIDYATKMTPLQRAAFCYIGDLHHLKKYNDQFVRKLFDDFISPCEYVKVDDPKKVVKSTTTEVFQLAVQIQWNDCIGINTSSEEFYQSEACEKVALRVIKIEKVLDKYHDLIVTLFRTTNVPSSISYFPSAVRNSSLMSDTDSAIFTVEDWVYWYEGKMSANLLSKAVSATAVFFAAETIKHVLANMSVNLGAVPKYMFKIEVKNEYRFEVFIPTAIKKHYYALMTYREGNIYKEPKVDAKGVHLISSNAPPLIDKFCNDLRTKIMVTIANDEKIDLLAILKECAQMEQTVIDTVMAGKPDYYRVLSIKDKSAYQKDEHESPYRNHTFWNNSFGQKYGIMHEPPYNVYKVSLTIKNKTAVKEYLDTMEDRELANNLTHAIAYDGRSDYTNFYVPWEYLQSNPLPKEILDVVDIRGIVHDVCHTIYAVLETLGYYRLNKGITRLLTDEFKVN